MSKTTPVAFGDEMFWAYDVGLGVLLAVAVDVAEEIPRNRRPAWWRDLVEDMRFQAVMDGSVSLLLHEYTVDQRAALLGWVAEAGSRLASRGGVSREEVAQWDVLDGETIHLRGAEHVDAGPLVELAQAMADLAAGTMEPAPEGRYWYFGTPSGRIIQGG